MLDEKKLIFDKKETIVSRLRVIAIIITLINII